MCIDVAGDMSDEGGADLGDEAPPDLAGQQERSPPVDPVAFCHDRLSTHFGDVLPPLVHSLGYLEMRMFMGKINLGRKFQRRRKLRMVADGMLAS